MSETLSGFFFVRKLYQGCFVGDKSEVGRFYQPELNYADMDQFF